MERSTAIQKLYELTGQVLQDLAPQYGITIDTLKGTTNKGWAGHLCEEYLGLPINSSQKPDFGDWELKSIYQSKLSKMVNSVLKKLCALR